MSVEMLEVAAEPLDELCDDPRVPVGHRSGGSARTFDTGRRCLGRGLDATGLPRGRGLRGDRLAEAYAHATTHRLPSGRVIRLVDPPHLLATKLEAFGDRGADDVLASEDVADIVTLLDGRHELVDEVLASPHPLRRYVARRFGEISVHRDFVDGLHGNLPPDQANQARVDQIVLPRIERRCAGA